MSPNLFKKNTISFLSGFIFAIGLAISGMTQPQKIIAFLNPADWDPSLLFVMMAAVGFHAVAYKLIRKRSAPILDVRWHLPTRKDVTPRLLLGSLLFGVGWGLGGFCPGPGVVSVFSGDIRALVFVVAMISGMIIFKKTQHFLKLRD